MSEGDYKRVTPQNDLDLQFMTTDPVWGKPEIAEELRDRLNKIYYTQNEKGEEAQAVKSLWGLLSFYTRDMRLANLNMAQLEYVKHYLDFAGDCLQEGLIHPFVISLSRGITILELSQSKGGFLRRRQGTLTQENLNRDGEPQKRKMFNGKNKGGYE